MKSTTDTKQKQEGRYSTPQWLAELMLDEAGFKGTDALSMIVMEPCFGDGTILSAIVERMFEEGSREGLDADGILNLILTHIYGAEKDPGLYAAAIERLDAILKTHGLEPADWSATLYNEDICLLYDSAKCMFDLVVGVPPCIPVKDMSREWYQTIALFRTFDIASAYTVFYPIGLRMLNKKGRLVYVSPNEFMRNRKDHALREFILRKGLLKAICDLRSSKVFPDGAPCVSIYSLDRDIKREDPLIVRYRNYDKDKEVFSSSIGLPEMLDRFPDGHPWELGEGCTMRREAVKCDNPHHLGDYVEPQSGIATNRDGIYIFKVFEDKKTTVPYSGKHTDTKKTVYLKNKAGLVMPVESDILHRCIKAKFGGKYDNRYILFPYVPETDGRTFMPDGSPRIVRYIPMDEKTFEAEYPLAFAYLSLYRTTLAERSKMAGQAWFLFGRSQGIANSCCRKLVFKHILPKANVEIRPYIVDEDVIITNGFFMTVRPEHVVRPAGEGSRGRVYDIEREEAIFSSVSDVLQRTDFARYCAANGKDKAGGYIEVSIKMIKDFEI